MSVAGEEFFYLFIICVVLTGKCKKFTSNIIDYYKLQTTVLNRIFLGPVLKTKWKTLVDTFRKKDKSGSQGGTQREKAEQWRFFCAMSFMRP